MEGSEKHNKLHFSAVTVALGIRRLWLRSTLLLGWAFPALFARFLSTFLRAGIFLLLRFVVEFSIRSCVCMRKIRPFFLMLFCGRSEDDGIETCWWIEEFIRIFTSKRVHDSWMRMMENKITFHFCNNLLRTPRQQKKYFEPEAEHIWKSKHQKFWWINFIFQHIEQQSILISIQWWDEKCEHSENFQSSRLLMISLLGGNFPSLHILDGEEARQSKDSNFRQLETRVTRYIKLMLAEYRRQQSANDANEKWWKFSK